MKKLNFILLGLLVVGAAFAAPPNNNNRDRGNQNDPNEFEGMVITPYPSTRAALGPHPTKPGGPGGLKTNPLTPMKPDLPLRQGGAQGDHPRGQPQGGWNQPGGWAQPQVPPGGRGGLPLNPPGERGLPQQPQAGQNQPQDRLGDAIRIIPQGDGPGVQLPQPQGGWGQGQVQPQQPQGGWGPGQGQPQQPQGGWGQGQVQPPLQPQGNWQQGWGQQQPLVPQNGFVPDQLSVQEWSAPQPEFQQTYPVDETTCKLSITKIDMPYKEALESKYLSNTMNHKDVLQLVGNPSASIVILSDDTGFLKNLAPNIIESIKKNTAAASSYIYDHLVSINGLSSAKDLCSLFNKSSVDKTVSGKAIKFSIEKTTQKPMLNQVLVDQIYETEDRRFILVIQRPLE